MRSPSLPALLLGVALCVPLSIAGAQTAPPVEPPIAQVPPHSFTAQWITAAGAPGHDPAVLRLRKDLDLPTAPAHFIVHVSADNHFLLFVNGKRIGDGPAIGDVQHWRYETYDLAPALHAGHNVLAATVWNLGDLAPIRQITSHLGFVLDPDTPAEKAAATDNSWLAREDHGWSFLGKPAGMGGLYYVGSPGERMDGNALTWNWDSSNAPEQGSAWQPAVSLGRAVARGVLSEQNSWLLVPDTLPPMEFSPTSAGHIVRASSKTVVRTGDNVAHLDDIVITTTFPAAPVSVPAHTTATLLLDHDTLTTAYPTLTLSGGKGAELRLRYAEALLDDHGDKGNRSQISGKHLVGVEDQIAPDGADNRSYTPLDWRTWRYLEIDVTTADQPLRLDSLSASFTAFPFEHRAHFASDDPYLAHIWEVGWRTARLCAHDAYMDTPYWERLQYVGDTRIQTLISYTNAGDDRLPRQAIEAFHASLLPEGIGQSRYPSRHLQVIQNFSLLWIGMVHDFWYYRNDPAFVRQQLPAIRSELSYFRARRSPEGLPELRDLWPFVDWATGFEGGDSPATPEGVSAAGSLFYLDALRNAAELERALGDAALAREDTTEADALAQTIYARFWSANDALLADTPALAHFSQQANALAVSLDVIPRAQQQQVITRVYSLTDSDDPNGGFHTAQPLPANMSPASNYFRFYLTRALVHAGLADRYLDTLTPWHTMLSVGLTTWAEQPEPTRSDSHAWAAHPNIDLLTTVAGIRPAAPDFGAVEIAPALGPLHHLAVSYPSPRGTITADYTGASTGVRATLTLPSNLPAKLIWNGKSYILHAGENTLTLPPRTAP